MTEDSRTEAEKRLDSLRLLEETHQFPCVFMFKVIGRHEHEFAETVVSAVHHCVGAVDAPSHRTRVTPNGRHVSVTVEPEVESADQVLAIYARIQTIKGVVMVM